MLLSFDPRPDPGDEAGGPPPDAGHDAPARPPHGATHHRAVLLERVRARAAAEGHPTFPAEDEQQQQQALDGTLAAMEWPTRAEASARGARLVRVDPRAPVERALADALEAVFEAVWWPSDHG